MHKFRKQFAGFFGGVAAIGLVASGMVSSPARGLTPPSATWNFASDFASPLVNPSADAYGNTGVWAYMRGTPQASASYALLDTSATAECNNGQVASWTKGGVVPYIAVNRGPDTYCSTNFFPAGGGTVHPSDAEAAIIRWTSPVNGKVSIAGGVTDSDGGGGDGISWSIDKADTVIASGGFGNGGAQLFSAGTGGTLLTSITVAPGDAFYLSIGPKNGFSFDSTVVDFTITLTEGGDTTTTEAPTTTTSTTTTSTTIATPPPLDPQCANPTMVIPAKFRGTFKGTPGNDVILGRPGNDTIDGLGGDDIICSLSGKDSVKGGAGDDRIYGQPGYKTAFRFSGGPGNDVLMPRGGDANALYGDDGDDMLYGTGAKKETFKGGRGNDIMLGDDGNDSMDGGDGDDVIDGGGGVDAIAGGRGLDRCSPALGRYDRVRTCEIVIVL